MSRDDRPPYQPDGIQQPPLLQQPLPAATALLPSRSNSIALPMPVPLVADQDLRSSDPTSYATTGVYPLDYPIVPQMSAALAAATGRPQVSASGSSLTAAAVAAGLPFQQQQTQSSHHPQHSQQQQHTQQSTQQHPSNRHSHQHQPSSSTNTLQQSNVLPSQQHHQQPQNVPPNMTFPPGLRARDRTEFSAQPNSPIIPPRSISNVGGPLSNAQTYLPIEQVLSNSNTFSNLSSGIISHPLFSLLIKKVFESCGSNGFEAAGDIATHFSESESSARNLQNFAETQGLDRAFERWTTIDVFMSALISVFNSLPATMQTNNTISLNQPLQFSVVTGQKVVATGEQSWSSDPRGMNNRMNNYGIRSDRLIFKPNHGSTTRTPLSERAKAALEKWFQENLENPYPTVAQKMELAKVCDMSLSSVNNWFGNKRMRIKRKMLNVNSAPDPNGFSSGETPSISDKVLAPRSKWNAVVVSKMHSQEGREVVANATGRANLCTDDHDVVTSNVIRTGDPSNTIGLHDQRYQGPGPGRGLEHLP